MEIEGFVFIGGFLSLITLICFFVLCSHVADIRKILAGKNQWEAYRKHIFWGENNKALIALREEVWNELKSIRRNASEATFNKRLAKIRNIYEERLIDLGGEFPQPDYHKTFKGVVK